MGLFGLTTDKEVRRLLGRIQALEADKNLLSTFATNTSTSTENQPDRNNYKTYEVQTKTIYDMYNGETNYGSETLAGIVDMRTALIAGEGASVVARKKSTQKYIDSFMNYNKLYGSTLIEMVQSGEMEGKMLVTFETSRKDGMASHIKIDPLLWATRKYQIHTREDNKNFIEKVTYSDKDGTQQEIKLEYVYVKLGGTMDKVNDTVTRIGSVLTQIENYSRCLYDLRQNNHLFAKVMLWIKTNSGEEAKSVNSDLQGGKFKIGTNYAGTADGKFIAPPTGALETLKGEMLLNAKIISTKTGIPVHWLAWPEMLSNRATAENLLEVTNSATVKERLIWEEALYSIIMKAMEKGVEAGVPGAVIDRNSK
jgi:hypothetical protein